MKSYDNDLERIKPWKIYEKQITCFERDYSIEAGTLLGETKTLLMNVIDSYFELTESFKEWCDLASRFLRTYLSLFKRHNDSKANVQRTLLIRVLAVGINGMNIKRNKLNDIHSNFVTAAEKMKALNEQLQSDFDEKSNFFKSQVNKIKRKANVANICSRRPVNSAARDNRHENVCHSSNSKETDGFISGPFGLNISYNVASAVTEEIVTQDLRERLDSIKTFFTSLTSNMLQTIDDIEKITLPIENEIKFFSDLRNNIEEPQAGTQPLYAEHDVVSSVEKLISLCNQYQEQLRISQINASQIELCVSVIMHKQRYFTTEQSPRDLMWNPHVK